MVVSSDAFRNGFWGIKSMDQVSLEPDQKIESDGNPHPHHGPEEGLPEGELMVFPVEQTQVDSQHQSDEYQE
jgi:hypothetical protein